MSDAGEDGGEHPVHAVPREVAQHTKPASLDAMALSEKDLTLYGSWCWNTTDWPRIVGVPPTGTVVMGISHNPAGPG